MSVIIGGAIAVGFFLILLSAFPRPSKKKSLTPEEKLAKAFKEYSEGLNGKR